MEKITGNIGPQRVELIMREPVVDWDKFRREAALAAMQAVIGNDTIRNAKMVSALAAGESPHKEIAATSVRFADALIEQLKEE